MDNQEMDYLLDRIKELENRVAQLRINRRVLLSLLETVEQDKNQQIYRLEKEKRMLQLKNARLARLAFGKQKQLTLVEGCVKHKS